MKYIFIHIKENFDITCLKELILSIDTNTDVHYWLDFDDHEKREMVLEQINFHHGDKFEYCFASTGAENIFAKKHICYYSSELQYNQNINPYNDSEVFIFLDEVNNSDKIKSVIISSNCNICLSISPIFIEKIDQKTLYNELLSIYQLISNPIFEYELTLQDPEIEHNWYIIVNDKETKKHQLIMGYHGDYVSTENIEAIKKVNLKNLLTDKRCSQCEFLSKCTKRCTGYIREENKITGCFGLKLLTKGS